jgi:ATP-binding cassette, subfamily B, bacterial
VIELSTKAEFMNEFLTYMRYPTSGQRGENTRRIAASEDRPGGFEFRAVSFRYPETETWALRDLNLVIPSGQKLSIVGENGAGKTTFIKLLCRLYDPTEGQILWNGTDIRELDHDDYRRLFTVVFQDFGLLAFSVNDNVILGGELQSDEREAAARKSGFDERLKTLDRGWDTSVTREFDNDGVNLSGGEAQKLAMCRALYRPAAVAILDEPTAALDPVAEFQVYRRFDEMVSGKTAIYISHRLSSCRFCDRIAVFHHGALSEYGTHDELCRNGGRYAAMWQAQAKYYRW